MDTLEEIRAWLDRYPGACLELVSRLDQHTGRRRYRAMVSDGSARESVGYSSEPGEAIAEAMRRAEAEGVVP